MDEKLRLRYLELYEDFSKKSIPEELKYIFNQIRPDLIKNGNNSFSKNYIILGFDLNIIVDYKCGDKKPYYSNIDIYKILTELDKSVEIKINIVDLEIDINYLMSVISHEIRHIYDLYTTSSDIEINEFLKVRTINKYMNTIFRSFINLVYLSLEHELISNYNMLYEQFRWINITDKNKLYEIFKMTFTYTGYELLKNFDSDSFIKNHNINELKNFTNEFILDIKDNFEQIIDINDLLSYYKKWEMFFKNKSEEYLSYIDNMLDEVIYDIINNKVYERLCGYISYNEDIGTNRTFNVFNRLLENKNMV